MKRQTFFSVGLITAVFLLLTLFTPTLFAQHDIRRPATYWNGRGEQPANVTKHTLESQFLRPPHNIVGFNIFLPPSYDPANSTARYPVIYMLHGANGHEYNYFRAYDTVDALYSEPSVLSYISGSVPPPAGLTMPEAIVVFVNGGRRSGYYDYKDAFHGPNSDFPIMSESIILQELIPYVDANFHTIANRTGRAIEGFSMGATGALRIGMKHPHLFCSVVAYGTGFLLEGERQPIYYNPPEERLVNISMEDRGKIIKTGLHVRTVNGDRDTPPASETMAEQFSKLGFVYEFELDLPNTRHSWREYYVNSGAEGLDFHQRCFSETAVSTTTSTDSPPKRPASLTQLIQQRQAGNVSRH